jgi:hypothetical protein
VVQVLSGAALVLPYAPASTAPHKIMSYTSVVERKATRESVTQEHGLRDGLLPFSFMLISIDSYNQGLRRPVKNRDPVRAHEGVW